MVIAGPEGNQEKPERNSLALDYKCVVASRTTISGDVFLKLWTSAFLGTYSGGEQTAFLIFIGPGLR